MSFKKCSFSTSKFFIWSKANCFSGRLTSSSRRRSSFLFLFFFTATTFGSATIWSVVCGGLLRAWSQEASQCKQTEYCNFFDHGSKVGPTFVLARRNIEIFLFRVSYGHLEFLSRWLRKWLQLAIWVDGWKFQYLRHFCIVGLIVS